MALDSTEWHWRDITLHINGVRIARVKKVTQKTARELEALHGAGDEAFDINGGNKTHTGELELYSSQIAIMDKAARSMGYADLTDVPWVLNIVFKATAIAPQEVVTIPGVRFSEREIGGANNEKAFVKTIPYQSLAPIYL